MMGLVAHWRRLRHAADVVAIQGVLTAYSHAIDRHRWDDLDHVFTPDAVVDYTELGGIRGGLSEIKAFLARTLGDDGPIERTQHMNGLGTVSVVGDEAHAVTPCFNPMITRRDGTVYFCGLWYEDRLVRGGGAWRIAERHERLAYKFNRPEER